MPGFRPFSAVSMGTLCLTWGAFAPACSEYDFQKATDEAPPVGENPLEESEEAAGEPDPGDEEEAGTPDIAVSPSAIDYGLVAVGDARTEVAVVSNEGDRTLTVDAIDVVDGAARGYAISISDPLPWTLAPGEGRDVLVTFTPVDTAEVTGLLEVASDDPDEPVLPVDLTNDVWLECTDETSASVPWKKSDLWYGSSSSDTPVDSGGHPWFSPYFDDAAWSVQGALPDHEYGTEDHDVFYRATFWLDAVAGTTEVEFEGNDGVWLYVNGTFAGHWGGDWREGGCINDPTGECSINYEAPPTDVTSLLREGRNTMAVMLTNGPSGYYLDIRATCVE